MHLNRLPPTHPQWAQAHNFNNSQIYYAGIMRDPQPLVLTLLGWGIQSEGYIYIYFLLFLVQKHF